MKPWFISNSLEFKYFPQREGGGGVGGGESERLKKGVVVWCRGRSS